MDYLLLLSSIVLGALSVFGFRLHEPKRVKLLNAFTGAYLLCLTFLHLLPELYHTATSSENPELKLGILILAGFAGLCLHALVEAMALGNPLHHYDPASRKFLLWSIVLHNFPVSIALLGMLLQSGMKRGTALAFLGLFAAMAPLGMFLSSHSALENYSRELTAVVIGIFMHIATTILFEASDIHRFNFAKLAAIVLGTALGFLSVMLH